MEPGAPRRASRGSSTAAGLWRMPRISGNSAWPAKTSATSPRSNQAWPTQAVGRPVRRANWVNQRVSPSGSRGSYSVSTWTMPTTLKSCPSRR
jgi:hypothetical protein